MAGILASLAGGLLSGGGGGGGGILGGLFNGIKKVAGMFLPGLFGG